MERTLEECLIDFIVKRCAEALKESEHYDSIQNDSYDKDEVLDVALTIGYKRGVLDAIKIFNVAK